MSAYIGIDTSNYTTSVAVFDDSIGMISRKKLLPVESNERGLMQSKALFCHIRQLPEVSEAAFSAFYDKGGKRSDIRGVCVSEKPRSVEGSYMPVFLAGVSAASAIAQAMHIPLYRSSHQIGHVLAALFSAGRLDLIHERFAAFHMSGGTTELLSVAPDAENIIQCDIAAKTLDLSAGQVIDRVGVQMGLMFPAGAELDRLSAGGRLTREPKICLKGADCCLSGLENICGKMLSSGERREDVARFALEFICRTAIGMRDAVLQRLGDLPMVYAGGVMSNSLIRASIGDGIFAAPEFSCDNAAGMAVAAKLFCENFAE